MLASNVTVTGAVPVVGVAVMRAIGRIPVEADAAVAKTAAARPQTMTIVAMRIRQRGG